MKTLKKLILSVLVLSLFSFENVKEVENKPMLVVIDVAHGGKDSGLTLDGLNEKDIVSNIANRIVALNTSSNIKIKLNRTEDTFVSLKERVSNINSIKPDLVISLHINGSRGDEDLSGIEVFTFENDETSLKFAELLQNEFANFNAGQDLSLKNARFYLLKNIESPVVHLELGYLTNKKDREIILSDTGQEEIAKFILESIQNFN